MSTANTEPEQAQHKSITRKESSAILIASVIAAASAFISTVVARQFLDSADVTEFLVFWSLLFGIYGVIGGIASEATRSVGAVYLAHGPHSNKNSQMARPAVIALGIGIVAAAVVVGTSPLWAYRHVHGNIGIVLATIATATILYSVQVAMSGSASGMRKWYLVATINGGEATWRFIAVLIVGALAGSLWGLEAAVVSPALLWIVLTLCSTHSREVFLARGDVRTRQLVTNTFVAMGSAAASAALTTGFPVLMAGLENADKGSHADKVLGALIFAISITRSPIMIPLQAFQGVAISLFLKQSHRPVAAMAKPVAALLGIGAVGGLAAYFIGPWLFLLLTHPRPDEVAAYTEASQGLVLGLLTFASAIMALLVLSGTAVLAMNLHKTYILGWVIAAAVALGLLYLPLPLIARAIIALFMGPLAGFATHMGILIADAKGRGANSH